METETPTAVPARAEALLSAYRSVRELTERLCEGLATEDAVVGAVAGGPPSVPEGI